MLFAQEAEQRLGRLGQLVIELEQSAPGSVAELIAEIFREVHTLKGSAAVVGFADVGTYAHTVEDKLGLLRSGLVEPTPAIVDALLVAVDRLGVMIWASVGDEPVDAEANQAALLVLEDAITASSAVATPAPVDSAPVNAAPADSAHADPAPADHEVSPPPALHIVPDPILKAQVDTPAQPAKPSQAAITQRSRPSSAQRDGSGTVMVPVERLDELVRMVGEAAAAHLRVGRVLSERIGMEASSLAEFSELSRVLNGLQERAMRTRMVPVSTITDSLQRAVRDASRTLGKDVRWEVRGESTELDRGVLMQLSDSLLHLVRNSIDHGIESAEQRLLAGKPTHAVVRLHAMQLGSEVIIAVSDDGGGIDLDRVRAQAVRSGIDVSGLSDDDTMQLIFRSGFSTAKFVSDISGRGVGLDAVRASVEAARGRVEVRSTPGVGSEFRIVVPITLAVLRCLLVEAAGQRFALPLHRVALAQAEEAAEIIHAEGRRMILLDGQPVVIAELADVLGLPSTRSGSGTFVIVNGTVGRHAFLVDSLIGQRDVVVKGLSALVPRLDVVAGASVEPDGSILLVLDPPGLIERSRRDGTRATEIAAPQGPQRRSGRLLVVDDALTVRELQRTILERAGFDVTVACDGVDALEHQ